MKHEILLVDSERRSVRVLDVALRSAGYSVRIAGNGLDALEKLDAIPPDVVVTDSHLPKLDGYGFLQKLRERPETAHVPGIVMMEASEDWGRWRALGGVERLPKPVFVRELVACVGLLITRSARARLVSGASRSARVSGSTEDLAVVDLLQAVEMMRETGVLYLLRRAQQAEIQFRSGRAVDACVGRLRGERAIYAVLGWGDASFELEFKPVDNHDIIDRSTGTLLVEGMRRLDETASNFDQGRATPNPEVDHVRLLEEVGLRPSGEGPSSSDRDGKGLSSGPASSETRAPAASAHSVALPSPSNGVTKAERDEQKAVAADEPTPPAQPPTAKSPPKTNSVDPALASFEGEFALFSELTRPEAAGTGRASPSSRPWTREVDPSSDLPLDDDPPISRVPREVSGTAKRVVAASVAVAALICVTAGLRAISVRRERLADDARRSTTPIALSLPVEHAVVPSAALSEPDPVASESPSVPPPPPPPVAAAAAPGDTKPDSETREEKSPPAEAPVANTVGNAGTTAATADSPPHSATREAVDEHVEAAAMPPAEHHAAIETRVAPAGPSASAPGAASGAPRASSPAALVKEAEQALLQGANARAVQLATEAVTTSPADAAGWLVLASAHRAMGEDDAARTDYRNCVAQAQTAGVTDCRILAGH